MTTTKQNAAHRTDATWRKTPGRRFVHRVSGGTPEAYISEYVNVFTGQAIRKDWRMTGRDWVIFSPDGEIVGRAHSLTWAKMEAGS